ncbi:MAG: glycosyltransferase family 2 protein [Clostridia bacterium]|nr:glycosyltransferase family 2 protein [Clostridia bacterium]
MIENIVSVIIPLYNAEKYIKRCILSIVNQTYKHLEIIIINDGSTDKSLDIINCLKNKYDYIKVYTQKNKGVSSARNEGIKKSTGEYIFFADADDFLEPSCIQIMLEEAISLKADIIRSNYYLKNKNVYNFKEKKIYDITNKENRKKIENLYLNTYFFNNVWGQLIKREIIKNIKFDIKLKMGEDFKFNLEILNNAKKIVVITDCLYNYTYNTNGMNYNDSLEKIEKKIKDICSIYEWLYHRFNKKNVCKIFLRGLSPQLLKVNEYKNNDIIKFVEQQNIFINTTKMIKISDLNMNKFYIVYVLVLKRKWYMLRMTYFFTFKPIKKIKDIIKK